MPEKGVSAMLNYRAIHLLTYFRETFDFQPGDFPVAQRIGNETISLPFDVNMGPEHVPVVVAEDLKDLLEGSA